MPIPHESDEQFIRATPFHWVRYVLPVFLYGIFLSASVFAFSIATNMARGDPLPAIITFSFALFVLLLIHHWFFHRLLGLSLTQIIVTNRRLITLHESLFFRDTAEEVPLSKVCSVEAEVSGILHTILKYGTLHFDLGGSTRHIHRVPKPHTIAKELDRALEKRETMKRVPLQSEEFTYMPV
jgi:hypothetical protein